MTGHSRHGVIVDFNGTRDMIDVYKRQINYSIIRGKMQVKFSGENHGFLWQNVKFKRLIFEDKTIL